jgi:hypothetical protein
MRRALIIALGTALFATASTLPLVAQAGGAKAARAASAAAYKVPRNAFGQPDFSGNWSNVSMTPEARPGNVKSAVYTDEQAAAIEQADAKVAAEADKPIDPNKGGPAVGGDKPLPGTRPEFIAAGGGVGGYDRGWLDAGARIMRVNGEPRTSVITTPDGRPPKTKVGVAPERGYGGGLGSFDNPENRALGERCIIGFGRNAGPPMLANGFYNNDYKIVQTKDEVAIVIEMVHDIRHIRLNGTHRTDGVRPWMGDSIGHYEGDTLVVETTNIPQAMAYHGAWKELKVTERFTRKGPDRLLYQFTVEDPTVWDTAWGGEYEFHPLKGELYEYACAEGNYALEHMLAGARQEEKAKAAKGS